MVVISPCSQKCRGIPHALRDCKSQYVAIESDRTVKIRHLEVDMTDASLRMNGGHNCQMTEKKKRCEDFSRLLLQPDALDAPSRLRQLWEIGVC